MDTQKSRKYVSPAREQRAIATKNRIIDAAEALLVAKGFAGMTVAEIASEAGVSQQTVYAVFGSKAGIVMAAIEERVLNDVRTVDAVQQLQAVDDPVLILQSLAKLVRYVYDGNAPTFAAMYGAAVVSPQLAGLEQELGEMRLAKQESVILNLMASGRLQKRLNAETARDVLWALTSREMYYLFVVRRGWSPDRYEEELASILVASLLDPAAIAGGPTCAKKEEDSPS